MKLKSVSHKRRYNKSKSKKVHTITVLTDAQRQKIHSIPNIRDKAICIFLLSTGLRLSEVTELDYGDVFSDIRTKTVNSGLSLTGKGNKIRKITLNTEARQAILYLDYYNREAIGVSGINYRTPLLISNQYNRLSNRMVEIMIKTELGCTPHVFRHTCFSDMRKAGVDGIVIQKAAGHSNFSTTARYYLSVDSMDIQDAFNSIDKPNKLQLVQGLSRA